MPLCKPCSLVFKSLVIHVLNFKSWIKHNCDRVDVCNFVINEFNPTFEVQNMVTETFQNASFPVASGLNLKIKSINLRRVFIGVSK